MNDKLDIIIGNKVKFRGCPGRMGHKMGIQITEIVEDERNEDEEEDRG